MHAHAHSLLAGALVTLGFFSPLSSARESPNPEETGSIRGRILFGGGRARQGVIPTDAVVYLVGEGLTPAPQPAENGAAIPLLDQRDLLFTPHVLPVPVGTKVVIQNSDGVTHNVHMSSKENRPFNRAQLAHMKTSVRFTAPEIIPVGCDIHSQMSAYIVVVPSSFLTQPGADGTYAISGIPAGDYELVAWQEKYGTVTANVTVAAGSTTELDLNFQERVTHAGGTP